MSLQKRLRDAAEDFAKSRGALAEHTLYWTAAAELDRLQARVAELEVDAARYRWLREQARRGTFGGVVSDAAIDTARKAKP